MLILPITSVQYKIGLPYFTCAFFVTRPFTPYPNFSEIEPKDHFPMQVCKSCYQISKTISLSNSFYRIDILQDCSSKMSFLHYVNTQRKPGICLCHLEISSLRMLWTSFIPSSLMAKKRSTRGGLYTISIGSSRELKVRYLSPAFVKGWGHLNLICPSVCPSVHLSQKLTLAIIFVPL